MLDDRLSNIQFMGFSKTIYDMAELILIQYNITSSLSLYIVYCVYLIVYFIFFVLVCLFKSFYVINVVQLFVCPPCSAVLLWIIVDYCRLLLRLLSDIIFVICRLC